MTESYTINNNFKVIVSFNQNTIYIRVKDIITSRQYETNVDERTLRLQFSLKETYQLIVKTFDKIIINECIPDDEADNNFKVEFVVKTNVLELVFNLLLHDIVRINFTVLMKEKIISGNEEATLILNDIEEKFNSEISLLKKKYQEIEEKNKQLMKFIEKVSFAEIVLYNCNSPNYGTHIMIDVFFPINSTEVFVEYDIKKYQYMKFNKFYDEKLKLFYQLKKITFEYYVYADFTTLSNDSVEELIIKPSPTGAHVLTSINGINNFPNLKILHVEKCASLKDVYNSLSNIKHNIKHLTFIGCTNIDQQNLKLYCEQNKIHLQIA
jgi:hypothetical protein